MDTSYTPPQMMNESTRRSIARELSKYYDELAGAAERPQPRFSLARLFAAMNNEHGLRDGFEREICSAAAMAEGESFDPRRVRVPLSALATRTLVAGTGSAGGFLAQTDVGDVAELLRPWSVVAAAGVTVLPNLRGNLSLPRVVTAASAAWVDGEVSDAGVSQPVLGAAPMVPRTLAVGLRFSRQWGMQAAGAEEFIRRHLLRSVGEALDAAFFAGSGGSGEPRGLLSTSGIGTQNGANLSHAGTLAMRASVVGAGAAEAGLQWVGAPGVQQTLGARERAAGSGRFVWDSDILGARAAASKNVPAGVLCVGDFSQAVVGIWGANLLVEVNPFDTFVSGIQAARASLAVDFGFPRPEAFCAATSVS